MVIVWRIEKDEEGSIGGQVLRYCSTICLEGQDYHEIC